MGGVINKVINGDFEDELNGWVQVGNNATISIDPNGHDGGKCIIFSGTSAQKRIIQSQDLIVYPGTTYDISYWYQSSSNFNGTSNNCKFRIAHAGDGNHITSFSPNPVISTSWKKMAFTWTCPSDINQITAGFNVNSSVGQIKFDELLFTPA